MIDSQGYRANVCIVLTDGNGRLFWAKRIGQDAWQFPQGGVAEGEDNKTAMYRELNEEVGLGPEHVKILATNPGWLRYKLPPKLVRHDSTPVCIGQKQSWFLLKLNSDESNINFVKTGSPEFDEYKWVSYWFPLHEVISFKREVYRKALKYFAQYIFLRRVQHVGLNSLFSDVPKYSDDAS